MGIDRDKQVVGGKALLLRDCLCLWLGSLDLPCAAAHLRSPVDWPSLMPPRIASQTSGADECCFTAPTTSSYRRGDGVGMMGGGK